MLLNFNTGFFLWVRNRNQLIMNRRTVIVNYCTTSATQRSKGRGTARVSVPHYERARATDPPPASGWDGLGHRLFVRLVPQTRTRYSA
jgi:hypothetical protein